MREMDDWTDLVKKEMLVKRITLDEYYLESMDLVQKGRIEKAALEKDRAELEARAQSGDEWWEWLVGTEPLRQMGGLALVRNGSINWARNDWIS